MASHWTRLRLLPLVLATLLGACRDGEPDATPVDPGAGIPGVWYAKPGASGNGTSWAEAGDLNELLAVAEAGEEIWLARGVYRPSGAGRDATFLLADGVALYGGFAGNETARDQRDPAINVSALDGDLYGDDAPGFVNRGDNAYHVVTAVECGSDTVLDGLTIQGGAATGPGNGPKVESDDQGAAVTIFGGHPTFVGIIVEDNLAANHGAINDHGEGSLYLDCIFRSNKSLGFGGGLYIHDHAASTVRNGCFDDNEAALEGGGLYIRSMVGALVVDSMFERNKAVRGGGTFSPMGAMPMIVRCLYEENVAEIGGGGVFFEFNDGVVDDCVFEDNSAGVGIQTGGGGGGGSGGGGIWTTGGAPSILACEFRRNAASFGAGVYHIEDSAATVEDCRFEDNVATEAGGLYTLSSPAVVRRCVFLRNHARGSNFSVGGGVSNYFSDSVVEDCRFEANTAELGGGGLYTEGEDPLYRSCVFLGNEAKEELEGFGGGTLFGYNGRARMESCAFVGNRGRRGGAIHVMAFAQPEMVHLSLVSNRGRDAGGIYGAVLSGGTLHGSLLVSDSDVELGGVQPVLDGCLVRKLNLFQPLEALVEVPPLQGPDLLLGTQDDPPYDLTPVYGGPLVDQGADGALDPSWPWDARHQPRQVSLTGPRSADIGAYERGG